MMERLKIHREKLGQYLDSIYLRRSKSDDPELREYYHNLLPDAADVCNELNKQLVKLPNSLTLRGHHKYLI